MSWNVNIKVAVYSAWCITRTYDVGIKGQIGRFYYLWSATIFQSPRHHNLSTHRLRGQAGRSIYIRPDIEAWLVEIWTRKCCGRKPGRLVHGTASSIDEAQNTDQRLNERSLSTCWQRCLVIVVLASRQRDKIFSKSFKLLIFKRRCKAEVRLRRVALWTNLHYRYPRDALLV